MLRDSVEFSGTYSIELTPGSRELQGSHGTSWDRKSDGRFPPSPSRTCHIKKFFLEGNRETALHVIY